MVAAITLPALIQNYQKTLLKNQYKKAYSQFFNAIKLAQAKTGAPVGCWYWDSNNPYGGAVCTQYNDYGNCKKWTLADGSALPNDYNGSWTDCTKFYKNELFGNALKVAKYCPNNSLANGCITENYRGVDKVKYEVDPTVEQDPSMAFSDNAIKNRCESWLLADGTLIMRFNQAGGQVPQFLMDINGHKGPNKWGYDIFTFALKGTVNNGITKLAPSNYYYEEGGFSSSAMLFNAFSK